MSPREITEGHIFWLWQCSGAVRKAMWPCWAPIPNKPMFSVDIKQHLTKRLWKKMVQKCVQLVFCCCTYPTVQTELVTHNKQVPQTVSYSSNIDGPFSGMNVGVTIKVRLRQHKKKPWFPWWLYTRESIGAVSQSVPPGCYTGLSLSANDTSTTGHKDSHADASCSKSPCSLLEFNMTQCNLQQVPITSEMKKKPTG